MQFMLEQFDNLIDPYINWIVIEEVINYLQDDQYALKASSQTCLSLLPLCRKYIFQSIRLSRASKFGLLLDDDPKISDHVQKLKYHINRSDLNEGDVPVLERLHRVHTLLLSGVVNWNARTPRFRDALMHLMKSRSLTRLELAHVKDFPMSALLPCVNLTDLTLSFVDGYGAVVESYQGEGIILEAAVPQLRSFGFSYQSDRYAMSLLNARRYNDIPILDFHHIQTLRVRVDKYSDLEVTRALLKTIEKLGTLECYVHNLRNGCAGLASSMNRSSLSTLRKLSFQFNITLDDRDPLCGLCRELGIFAELNVIEELKVIVQIDYRCKMGRRWGRLDDALAIGFPMLRHVSLEINTEARSNYPPALSPETELEAFPGKYFPRLSTNRIVTFDFSSTITWLG